MPSSGQTVSHLNPPVVRGSSSTFGPTLNPADSLARRFTCTQSSILTSDKNLSSLQLLSTGSFFFVQMLLLIPITTSGGTSEMTLFAQYIVTVLRCLSMLQNLPSSGQTVSHLNPPIVRGSSSTFGPILNSTDSLARRFTCTHPGSCCPRPRPHLGCSPPSPSPSLLVVTLPINKVF